MVRLLIFFCIMFINCVSRADDIVQISSDNLILNKKDLSATFEGNVRVSFEDQTIFTDKLVIYYSDMSQRREITKIVFPVKIKVIKGCESDIAIADGGEFDNLTKKLTLSGNVQIQKDGNVLVTDKVIYFAKLKSVESKTNAK